MAYPSDPVRAYSFEDFAEGQGDSSFPGVSLDTELAKLFNSDASIINFIEGSVLRSDGGLKSGVVEYSSLGNSVLQYISETLQYLGPFGGTVEENISMNGYKLLGLGYGVEAAPGIAFDDDHASSGMYITDLDGLGFSVLGVTPLILRDTLIRANLPIRASVGTANAPAYAFNAAGTNCGMDFVEASLRLAFYTDGVERLSTDSTRTQSSVPVRAPVGTFGAPAFSFTGNGTTGAYYFATEGGGIGFSAAGALVARMTASGGFVTEGAASLAGILLVGAGTAATPAIRFSNDLDMGFYRNGADSLGVAAGGNRVALFDSDGLTVDGDLQVDVDATVTGLLTAADIAVTDDLTVAGDTALAGDLSIGGAATGAWRFRSTAFFGASGNIDADTQVMIKALYGGGGDANKANFLVQANGSTDIEFGVLGDGRLRAENLSTATGTALIWTGTGIIAVDSSSKRYKTEIRPYEKGLADLMRLRPRFYEMIDAPGPGHAGLIAEELAEAGFPEFVTHNRHGEIEGIREGKMGVSLLVNAVQELARKVETLEARA